LLIKNPWTIFGPWVFLSQYWELEAENFFERIKLKNTSKLLNKKSMDHFWSMGFSQSLLGVRGWKFFWPYKTQKYFEIVNKKPMDHFWSMSFSQSILGVRGWNCC
jgi:hypothetical protein